ncbi:MAG TPA: SIS domain-containing protein [Vicinamibacterales bacterium]|nr:SIS domain-containing protein [Vicinamibacterales bacterium]
MERWTDYCDTIADGLRRIAVTDRSGAALATADGVARWVSLTRAAHDAGGQLYIIGNGGSAGMASHMAADACKNGHLRAMSFSDVALLTATSNDLAYDQVFSLPLERLARPMDLLIAISSSGNSPNIVRALEASRALGLRAVTLTGMSAENRARRLGDLNFYVPLSRYGWTESAHQVILHYWFDQYLCEHRQGAL